MNNEPQPSPHRVARLLTAGLAVAGTLGVGAVVDHAEHGWPFNQSDKTAATTEFTPAPANPNVTVTLPGETTTNRPETQQEMVEKAAYLKSLHCSGTLIDNKVGTAIAAKIAAHCLGDYPLHIIKGTDNQNYMIWAPIEVETGKDTAHMQTVGTIDRFIVDTTGQTDVAYGLFPGSTSDEVLAIEQAKPLQELKPGDKLRIIGYPADPSNQGVVVERQEFTTTVLGWQQNWGVKGRQVNILWTALPKGSPACAPGTSGANAYTVDAVGNATTRGTFNAYFDFAGNTTGLTTDQKESARNFYAQSLNADLSETPGICGIVTDRIDANNMVVNVVQKLTDIPGQTDDSTAIPLVKG